MSAKSDEIEAAIDDILSESWSIRDGVVVPEDEDVALHGGGVRMETTILYSDLARSTELASRFDRRTAARILRSFLSLSTRLIRYRGGQVRSFDGDRVMGIFVGDRKNTSALKCALNINWAVSEVLRPRVEKKYPSLAEAGWYLRHATGIDTSATLIVRAGIRNNNDLIWVGRAPNLAAKLSSVRDGNKNSLVTKDAYDKAHASAKESAESAAMWEQKTWEGQTIYTSSWSWKP